MKYSYDIETLENQVFEKDELALSSETEEEYIQLEEGTRLEEEHDNKIYDHYTQENLESQNRKQEEPEPILITQHMEDGSQMECGVVGVFLEGEKEYIALETPEGKIHIMELGREDDDGITLIPVENEEEQEKVIETFIQLFTEEEELNSQE